MSLEFRQILERSLEIPETPKSEEEISSKLEDVKEKEQAVLDRVQSGNLTLPELVEILTQLEDCKSIKSETQKAQEERVARAKQAVEDQEVWLQRIDAAINSLK